MLKNLENKGNPWGMNVPGPAGVDRGAGLRGAGPRPGRRGPRPTSSTSSGSAAPARWRTGPRRPPGPSPSCCTSPGVKFAVLGEAEACTGDPARRLGNEFVFQMLAQQNVETLNEAGADKKIVATCPHCFNTLGRRVPAARRQLRGRPPHPAAGPAGRGGPAHPGHADRPAGHLPRPVLPRPAQQGLHAAPRGPGQRPRPAHRGDAPLQGARLLLRRRRRADVDGGEDRQADQRRAGRRGARPGPRRRLHRLPVLPGHARRRGHREEAGRRRPARTSRSSTSASCCCARCTATSGGPGRRRRSAGARRPTA